VFKLPIGKGIGTTSFGPVKIFYVKAKITIKTNRIGAT